jgi:polysaccharide pyruvyl transferase WcaK-like protein
MINIVIINAVPINGGDEALLEATLLGLQNEFDAPNISILCNNPRMYKNYFPNLELDWDWEFVFFKNPDNENPLIFTCKKFIRKVLKKVIGLSYESSWSRIFASSSEKRVFKKLANASKVLMSAGGYIHDFYGYNKRLRTLSFIHDYLKVPYYIFSQSVGPFWNENNYKKLQTAFEQAQQVILRESYSLKHLQKIGYQGDNITVTNDIAFYLKESYAKKVNLQKELKKIAVNFREWKYQQDSEANLDKAIRFCKKLIKKGYSISFISTCQGVEGYVDDSIFAERIMQSLSEEQRLHCTVFSGKFSLSGIIDILSQQDAYIGMRLHGAILSLLAGIPALNIAYEDKTLGIYNALGLDDFCFYYNEDYDVWNSKVDYFIKQYKVYLHRIDDVTDFVYKEVQQNFKLLH